MTLAQTLEFMQPTLVPEIRLGLSRMKELMRRLGDPQKELRFIHVAGTNRKGPVCAMLDSILRQAGYVTGRYTSSHLQFVHERIKVNGVDITNKELTALAKRIKAAVKTMEDVPSEFERITAMALLYFRKRGCEVVVLEAGGGGRLDATNVIGPPDVVVIANVGMEHTDYQSRALALIAEEVSGIIKENSPVILCEQSKEAADVVQQVCRERKSKLVIAETGQACCYTNGLRGQHICYRGRKNMFLPLLGFYQVQNAMVALDCVDVLNRERGYDISEQAVRDGLANVHWPGRFEILMERPPVLLDGAHNPNEVEQLAASIQDYLPDRKAIFVMSVMADDDYRTMIRIVAPLAKEFIAVAADCPSALAPFCLKTVIESETGIPTIVGRDVKDGLKLAIEKSSPKDMVVIFGSLYQIRDIRAYLGK